MSDLPNDPMGEPESTGWQTVTPTTGEVPLPPPPATPPPPAAVPGGPTPVYTGTPVYGQPPVAYGQPQVAYGEPPKKKGKTWLWVLLGIFTFIVLGIAGCIGVIVHIAKTAGSDSAIQLHLKMQMNDLAGIYAAADPAYQQQVGRDKSDALFTRIHEQLGAPVSGTQTSVNIDNDLKTLVNTEHFAKGDGTETIKFHKGADGVYRLLGYDVKSPLLVDTPTPAPATPPSDGTTPDGASGSGSSSDSSGDNQP